VYRRASENPTCTIRVADYATDEPVLRAIRFEVFVDEQRVPAEIEMDDRDPLCIHFLAFEGHDAVGTARIDLDQAGKIGRLAVLSPYRRRGIGRALMQACHGVAREHGLDAVWCHAQLVAEPFYRSLGYRASGDVFDEAGIPHRHMKKALGERD
jgi:predicted GNAT family N-acyltransferase